MYSVLLLPSKWAWICDWIEIGKQRQQVHKGCHLIPSSTGVTWWLIVQVLVRSKRLYLFLAGIREWAVTEFMWLIILRSDFRWLFPWLLYCVGTQLWHLQNSLKWGPLSPGSRSALAAHTALSWPLAPPSPPPPPTYALWETLTFPAEATTIEQFHEV